jgi:hypothetical protein
MGWDPMCKSHPIVPCDSALVVHYEYFKHFPIFYNMKIL